MHNLLSDTTSLIMNSTTTRDLQYILPSQCLTREKPPSSMNRPRLLFTLQWQTIATTRSRLQLRGNSATSTPPPLSPAAAIAPTDAVFQNKKGPSSNPLAIQQANAQSVARRVLSKTAPTDAVSQKKKDPSSNPPTIQRANAQSVARRVLSKNSDASLLYPEILADRRTETFASLRLKYSGIEPGKNLLNTIVTIRVYDVPFETHSLIFKGRIKRKEDVSSTLCFFDLVQDGVKLQVVSNFKDVGGDVHDYKEKILSLSMGDIVSLSGYIGKSPAGELSVFATTNMELLASSLHTPQTNIQDVEKRFQHRHIDLIIRPKDSRTLRLRADIIQHIRQNFINQGFTEVATPIISDAAGGAIVKPFLTEATVYSGHKLALRIAPELWFKRLVLSGKERVFEIGRQFRNEGIENTLNPEFTTCEFYQAYANLEDLTSFTERLLFGLATYVQKLKETKYTTLSQLDVDFSIPFKRINFIPALEEALGESLPNLSNPEEAIMQLLALFERKDITIPTYPTLPGLLDKLSSMYLKPLCTQPTFIIHHPECLSPLSKSTLNEQGHRVSTRVELFIRGKELVNAYEEEYSPTEQRRKFLDQVNWKNLEEGSSVGDMKAVQQQKLVDKAFVAALEWGLPPTAVWGMGVDRLIMLFSGMERIADVLSFRGLRGVVG
ncbi:class II aaRS and biotin synthetase [Terfezia boudieri ATCC MYA-4762]|uniref:Lysyl-tRNA synthetase n=1 Tax=Terfezia boudieri ATCC MYA-4762 TaxID=1051890 RepID=A0A3N4LHJ7_9PEZI|nr:class II aaRS and biotin synthetase [Terfezia boudieri ATCC MYA-4762]